MLPSIHLFLEQPNKNIDHILLELFDCNTGIYNKIIIHVRAGNVVDGGTIKVISPKFERKKSTKCKQNRL